MADGKKTNSPKKDNNKFNYKLILIPGVVLVSVMLVWYLVKQISNSSIVTERALNIAISDEIKTTGITVRDEELLNKKTSGFIVSAVTEGRKVSKGEPIAYRFSSAADAKAFERINEIDAEIEKFKNMENAGEESAADANSLKKLLNERFNAMEKAINSGDLSDLSRIKSDMAYILNKRLIYMKKIDDFDDIIGKLKNERKELSQKYDVTPSVITADKSGYFVGVVDGYEKILTTSTIESLSADQLEVAMNTKVDVSDDHIGKIAGDYKWNIACIVTTEEAQRLIEGRTYTLRLPYSETGNIRAKLQSIKDDDDGKRSVLIFSCSYLFAELTSVRTQPVVIDVKTYEGLGIRESAITTRVVEKEQTSETDASASDSGEDDGYEDGVYVLWGNEVKFKKIKIVYRSQDGIVVVQEIKEDKENEFLSLYDDVIVEGSDLYDGKII